MKAGFGIQTWKDGAKYIGKFENDKACGIGSFKHADGDHYQGIMGNNILIGEFENERASGFGSYNHSNGSAYEGLWVEDYQQGVGNFKSLSLRC